VMGVFAEQMQEQLLYVLSYSVSVLSNLVSWFIIKLAGPDHGTANQTGPDWFVSSPVPNFGTGPLYGLTVQSSLNCQTVRSIYSGLDCLRSTKNLGPDCLRSGLLFRDWIFQSGPRLVGKDRTGLYFEHNLHNVDVIVMTNRNIRILTSYHL